MAEAVAGLLASAFVGIAKDKLGSAIADQANMLRNFGVDLEDMMDVFETISAVLEDAERRSVKEKLVQLWLKRLKDVAVDISDMFEDYQDTSDQTTAMTPGVLSCLPVAFKNIVVANRMKSLREKLKKIRNGIDSFNFIKGSNNTKEQPYDERETTSNLPEQPLIGRDGEKQEIIQLLSTNTNNDEIVIVPICGLGGMGKSTLAKLVYNDTKFKMYDHRIWVYVSQEFNLNKIGSSIISQLPSQGGPQNMGIQQVINKCLENLLQGKKVLIVLDDLWQEKNTELEKLRSMLHVKGSKVDVIVTTRKEEIARKLSTGEPYKLQPLEDDICWEIIKRSSRFELKPNKEKIEQIGLDIAKKCGGVPLAAQAIGYMLQSIDDLSGWTKINRSDMWNVSSGHSDVLPSLKLSYERMPPQLRICFSFCAIFPKGHNIIEDDLVQQWVSLGFTEQSKGKEYFNNLLGMSFLQVSKLHLTSQEHVVQYTMHDLVHDLATWTVEGELIVFCAAPQRNTRAHKYCRYSFLKKYGPTTKSVNIPSKIRALCFSDCGEQLDIPSGSFSFAKCLRTLDFSGCSSILLPASIGDMKQLRCLIAPRMQNESLPKCITELSKLQYLNINGSSKISALPDSVDKLGCLKYLCLSGCSGILELPESFGDFKSMIHLDMSGCSGIGELLESFGNLKSMVHLDMSGCSGLTKLPESFGNLKSMVHLDMSGCSGLTKLPDSIGILKRLQHLELSGCSSVTELPDSLGKLTNLEHLVLSGCSSVTELPDSLGKLTNLQHLELSRCSRLKAIPEPLCGLRQLQYLNLSGCEQVRELPESLMKLQNLLHLDLSWCHSILRSGKIDLQNLSAVLANLTNLKYLGLSNLTISGAEGSASYVPDWIGGMTNLEHLDLSFNTGLACLPASIGNLKRLHTLDLTMCYNLKSLPESIRALELKSLVLHNCSEELVDQASSLVHFSQTLPDFKVRADDVNCCSNLHLLEGINVSELRISSLENVWSLEEANKVKLLEKQNLSKLSLAWTRDAVRLLEDKDLLGQLVPPRGLKHMHLQGYNGGGFPGWLMCIYSNLTNLISIRLHDMSTCSNLPPLGQLPHLENLFLWKLPGIKRIDREVCGGKGAFRRLSSFKVVVMDGLEEWNTTYSVEDGVEEFMFPVLDSLIIRDCPRLRLKPCPPTFHECTIALSNQVIYSLEELVDKTSQISLPSSRAIKLDLSLNRDSYQSIRIFHHFPALRELTIYYYELTSLPESMRHLTSLESLTLLYCNGISSQPEWLGDLSSLKSLVIQGCKGIKSLPACIQQLTKLQKLQISYNKELKEWCESEENKAKLAHINIIKVSLLTN